MERNMKYSFLKETKQTQGKRLAFCNQANKEHVLPKTTALVRSVRPQKIPNRKY